MTDYYAPDGRLLEIEDYLMPEHTTRYLATLTYPLAYDASDDNHARVIAEHLDDTLALVELPHGAQIQNDARLQLEHDDRVIVPAGDDLARYAPLLGVITDCPACLDYIRQSTEPGDSNAGSVTVELLEEDDA